MGNVVTEILRIVSFMGQSFISILPYLVVSIPVAVYLRVSGLSDKLFEFTSVHPFVMILFAALLGAFSPLCSCSVIPFVSVLLSAGLPLAPVMTFWLASPSIDPEVFLLSAGLLGWHLAVVRLVVTLVFSISAGFITYFLVKYRFLGEDVLRVRVHERTTSCCQDSGGGCSCSESAEDCSCKNGQCQCDETGSSYGSSRLEIFITIREVMLPVLASLTAALFLQAVIVLYVSQDWISTILGQKNALSVLFASLAGLPLYTNNLAAIGIVQGFLVQGMNPGAALAFLISGPVTTLPAMAAVYSIAKPHIFILYVSFALFGSLVFGYIYYFLML